MSSAVSVAGSKSLVTRFTFRRLVIGSLIFGLFASIESVAQGLGIVLAYPNIEHRAKIIYGLASNSALGLFYGDRHTDIISGPGYMVYRILPILALIGSIWSLLFYYQDAARSRDSGRWELLLTGQTTARKATSRTIIGSAMAIAVSYVLLIIILMLAGTNSKFGLSLSGSLFFGLAVVSGAYLALGVGAVTSQLAATRRLAVLYGLVLLILFFVMRSVANVVYGLAWLKNLTVFGWVDKLHPFYHPQYIWLLPIALFTLIGCGLGIWLSGKRDMNESFIADSSTSSPRFGLLNSQLGFDFRLTRNVMFGWLVACVGLASLIASIDKTVSKSLASASSVTKIFGKLAGNPYAHLETAYLSAASYFIVIILMVLATNSIASAREEEASSRLDNFISASVSRRRWLVTRLALLTVAVIVITFVSNLFVWAIADIQGIHVSLSTMLFGGLNVLGPVIFLLGVGVLLYGYLPRVATISMYTLIGWSFTIDIITSAIKTSKYVADTSLLHHISLVPAANPKWRTFFVLTISGLILAYIGVIAFTKRDIEVE